MKSLIKHILLSASLCHLSLAMEAELPQKPPATQSLSEGCGYYGRLLASEETQEEMITKATIHTKNKVDLIDLFIQQFQHATYDCEGSERESAKGIHNFLKEKKLNTFLKLEMFQDSFDQSAYTRSMKDVGIGKFNRENDEEKKAAYALSKHTLYEKILDYIKKYNLKSFEDNHIITTAIEEWLPTVIEDFKKSMCTHQMDKTRQNIRDFINSLTPATAFRPVKPTDYKVKDASADIQWEYAERASELLNAENFINSLLESDTSFRPRIPLLSALLNAKNSRFDRWLVEHSAKWSERHRSLIKENDLITNLNLLLSRNVRIDEEANEGAK